QMHSANLAAAENCGVPKNDYVGQYSYLQNQAREFLFPLIDQTERDFIERAIKNYLESADNFDFRPALLHGDLSHDHLLYDQKTKLISGVIDFGDMLIGDPAWDFLWLYEDYGADFLTRLLAFYQENDKHALIKRVYNYSLLQTIEWATDCSEKNDACLEEAMANLKSKIKQ
ncbi:MAG TPA: aminoglycoside phosphotransferase family protein, partial [Pyrinomonadaceae bacterium]|nr:aminoglycoside phosphotransferase family protein [Pyrinomonadaceae bacterium]